MNADFFFRNAIDAVGIFSYHWKLKEEQAKFFQKNKKHVHIHINNCYYKHLEIANSCFSVEGILWRRIVKHNNQITVIIAPKSLT
jgi:hypothetical protein